jgi:hypothetical protein
VATSSSWQGDTAAVIAQARQAHFADINHYGNLSEVKNAVQVGNYENGLTIICI